ncbi:MAG: amidohydrolase family protein [Synergistaceae bacterium]|nr:amidohydrolase family protein [Synergistaceae bacterium]
MFIVDAHVHIYPPEFESNRDSIATGEPWFDKLTKSKVHRWVSAEDLIASMDKNNIACSYATSFAFHDQGLCRIANDYVLNAAKQYPNRIKALTVVSPNRPGACEEIARCAEEGAIGVGEIFPEGQNFDITNTSETWRLVSSCLEHNLFLMFHTAEQVGHQYSGKGNVGAKEAAKFCLNHSDIKVIFSHFGAGLWAFEAMPEMKLILSNAYYDTAAMPWLYNEKILDAIFAIGAGHKILFGSDWPILDFSKYKKLLDLTRLDTEQKSMLLKENVSTL